MGKCPWNLTSKKRAPSWRQSLSAHVTCQNIGMLLCSQLIIPPASANLLNLVMEASGFVVKHGKNRMHRDVMMQSSSTAMLIACHARQPLAACTGGRTDVCGCEHSFLYRYAYFHWRVLWPRMASGYIIYNYEYFYLSRQSRRKLYGYVFLPCTNAGDHYESWWSSVSQVH
jgi:hypothetical protein